MPSPLELKASIVLGLNVAPSVPWPIGSVSRILPSSELSITMIGRIVARGKENVILHVERQPARPAALAAQIPVRGHFQSLGVHGSDLVLVFQIDIDVALAVA